MSDKPTPIIKEKNFKLKEQTFREWCVVVPHGAAFESILPPHCWASVAKLITKNDTIDVIAENGSFRGKLVVLGNEERAIQVGVLEYHDLTTIKTIVPVAEDEINEENYRIDFDAKSKWRVVRKVDDAVVIDKKNSEKAAMQALRDYLNDLAA